MKMTVHCIVMRDYNSILIPCIRCWELWELIVNEAVGIYNKKNFENICSIYACLLYGANFSVIDSNDSEDIWLVKKSLVGIDLLISDFYTDEYIVTVKPTDCRVNMNCGALKNLGDETFTSFATRTAKLYSDAQMWEIECNIDLPAADIKQLEQRNTMVYHKGATVDAFKVSIFTLDRVIYGIENSVDKLEYEGDKVLYMETFDLLYDIINGVVNPLTKGKQVLFTDTSSYENQLYSCMNLRATDMYVNAFTLEKILYLIADDLPDWVLYLKGYPLGNKVFKFVFKQLFYKIFGKQLKHIVVTGKIRNTFLLNCLDIRITTLYTMTEIASFVACKSHNKLKNNFSVGKVNTEDVLVVGKRPSNHGGVMLWAKDMSVGCIPDESHKESYYGHAVKGRLWTKDIGYIDVNDELHVIDKSSLIFEMDNGKLVMTGEMLEISLSKRFIKRHLLLNHSAIHDDLSCWSNRTRTMLQNMV